MARKQWTKQELNLLNNRTLTHTQVARLTGRGAATICFKTSSVRIKRQSKRVAKALDAGRIRPINEPDQID